MSHSFQSLRLSRFPTLTKLTNPSKRRLSSHNPFTGSPTSSTVFNPAFNTDKSPPARRRAPTPVTSPPPSPPPPAAQAQDSATPLLLSKPKITKKQISRLKDLPSFESFIRRQSVINLYRSFVRVALHIPDLKERENIMKDVKRGFEDANRSLIEGNENNVKIEDVDSNVSPHGKSIIQGGADFNFRYNLGKRELKNLERVVGYEAPTSLKDLSGGTGTTEGGWLDIKDEEDRRGRVGTEWPWMK